MIESEIVKLSLVDAICRECVYSFSQDQATGAFNTEVVRRDSGFGKSDPTTYATIYLRDGTSATVSGDAWRLIESEVGLPALNIAFKCGYSIDNLSGLDAVVSSSSGYSEAEIGKGFRRAIKSLIAASVFEEFDFGDEISIEATKGWETNDEGDFVLVAYARDRSSESEQEDTFKVSFHVRWTTRIYPVAEVYALDCRSGAMFGSHGPLAAWITTEPF